VNLLRRHPIALALLALVLLSALRPLPPLVDVRTGAPPADAELVRPTAYTVLAPVSNVLDALTFLSLERAQAFLLGWVVGLALWGALRRGTLRQRLGRALVGPLGILAAGGAAAALPRPIPRLVTGDSSVTVIDYHAHTEASHDGRPGWTAERLAAWHAAQGFQASYVTDHNKIFTGRVEKPIRLLPGVEWSVYRQHIVALGAVAAIKERTKLPLICDIHFDYRMALLAIEKGADKIRINPGNIINVDGTGLVQLTNGGDNLGPSWSPEGDWITFTSFRDGNNEIYIMHPDGTGVTRLTNNPTSDWQPRWGR